MTIQDFLSRLDAVRETANGWMARCPSHQDENPSLGIAQGNDGRILVTCFAGCPPELIIQDLGLTMADLFQAQTRRIRFDSQEEDARADAAGSPQAPGCTLSEYALRKKLPLDFLKSLGLVEITYNDRPAVRIPFSDEAGVEKSVLLRIALAGDNRFRWRSGSKAMLYGLPWLTEARAAGYVILVEGVSDVHVLRYFRIPAIGLPGARGWREEWASYFARIDRIFVIIEPDDGGRNVKEWLARSIIRDRVLLIEGMGAKDTSALYLQDPERFRERLQAGLDTARSWPKLAEAEAKAEADDAWAQCETLANEPRILDEFARDLQRRGIAGEERFGKLVFLATMSRFQPRPTSLAAKGPSAAGKSIVMQRTLDFFPPRAYYALSGMSERALVYSQEPLQQRMLVLYEAQGLQGNWASYLVRSLLSEGKVRYETVMKDDQGKLTGVLIDRPGPTGLLTTTTKILLHPENETRLLSVPVDDSPAQTRKVMREVARGGAQDMDLTRWWALQTWLQGAEHRVIIPYAGALAEIIPPLAVRLRRDFGMVLSLVKAHAVLHQVSRARDAEGWIIATLEDYAIVRELMADLMSEGIEASVPPIVRETVEVVRRLTSTGTGSTATVKQVARELGIDSPPALRRVRLAIARGFLQNLETKKGKAAQLVLGDPLPEDVVILPMVDDPRLAVFRISRERRGEEEAPSPRPDARGNGNGRADEGGLPEDLDSSLLPGDAVSPDDIEWGLSEAGAS